MIGQLWRFAGVGVAVTIIHVLVALLAASAFNFPAQVANFTGFCFALCISYFGHAFVTFKATTDHARQMPRFLMVALSGLVASSAITFLVHTHLQGSFAQAMAVVAVVVPPLTFLISKYWVFHSQHRPTGGTAGFWVSLGVAAVFIAINWGRVLNHDVAWYLVATRKWLHAGAQPYIDLIEINPPLNFYLTIPAILLGDILRISDTNAQYLVVALLLTASLTWVGRVLDQDQGLSRPRRLLILGFVGIAILFSAAENIAQREHLMLLFILPYVFGYLILPTPDEGNGARARAGLAAIGLCLKPHFMLYPIALTLLMIWRRRSLWPILSSANLVILSMGVFYIVLVMVQHPEYLNNIVPLGLQTYGAYGFDTDFIIKVTRPLAIILFTLMSLLVLVRPERIKGFGALFAVVAAAISIYLLQWTGFIYHVIPLQALIVISSIWILAQPKVPIPLALCSGFAGAYLIYLQIGAGFYHNPDYDDLSKALGKQESGYSLMVFSADLGPGFPLALEIGADWVSRYPAMWPIPGAVNQIATGACADKPNGCEQLRAILRQTRQDIVSDFANGAPDVLIFDIRKRYITDSNFSFHSFLSKDPRYLAMISDYEIKENLQHFTIMTRKF